MSTVDGHWLGNIEDFGSMISDVEEDGGSSGTLFTFAGCGGKCET